MERYRAEPVFCEIEGTMSLFLQIFSSLIENRFSSLTDRRFALLGLLEVSSCPLPRNAELVPFGQDYFYYSETTTDLNNFKNFVKNMTLNRSF